tara:strand:- start:2654 stop:3226 length:573 start_codon:yes stop_codon:yes gene_type:complete
MTNNFIIKILLGFSALIIVFFFSFKLFKEEKKTSVEKKTIIEDIDPATNIIKDVNYISKDIRGNEYILNANEGQIDLTNNEIIFLTSIKANINMVSGETINIQSDYGKYNIKNYDTIFSKNVIISYIDNEIKGDYVDFSLNRNSLIISKNVVYSNQKNILSADVVEIDIATKDAKIFMYEKEKKVKIRSN